MRSGWNDKTGMRGHADEPSGLMMLGNDHINRQLICWDLAGNIRTDLIFVSMTHMRANTNDGESCELSKWEWVADE